MVRGKESALGLESGSCLKWGLERCSGVYTVEAAFVMLISLFSIFSVIFFAFFLHDKQAVRSEMKRIVTKAAAEDWDERRIRCEWEQNRSCHLFYMKVEESKSDVHMKSGKGLEVRVSFPIPIYGTVYFQKTGRDGWLREEKAPYLPQEFARKTEALKEVFQ